MASNMSAPLPFIMVDDAGGFSVNPEAVARINAIKGKLVVVAVAGLYRTGKSFLLNLLMQHARGIDASAATEDAMAPQSEGFAVGGTVNACTKGIWMWGAPVELADGASLLFLDTEGLGSVDREQTHDTRIFALALLLATNFIYNSRGVIDGNAIEDLSLVVNLSKHIQTSSSSGGTGSGLDLHEFFPAFTWVVRDFTLQLQENGKTISSRQYLENALAPTGGYSDDAMAKDQIRSLLTDFFRQRDCVTLVRPVDDEEMLRRLPSVPYEELRPEFRSTFESLRRRVLDKAKPKTLFGKALNGAMFTHLAQSYVEALNSGKAPVIASAWSRVVQSQCEDAVNDAIQVYTRELQTRVGLFSSVEQYEAMVAQDQKQTTLEVVDYGQGGGAQFDEYGNLRVVAKPTVAVGNDNDESDLINVMEEEDAQANGGEQEGAAPPKERVRLPCAPEHLMDVHRLCKRLAKKTLSAVVENDGTEESMAHRERFRNAVMDELAQVTQQNAAASMTYCRHVLQQLSRSANAYLTDPATHVKSAGALFRDNQHYLDADLTKTHEEYFARAVGPSAQAAYCEYVSQQVVRQVVQRTEMCNAAHMAEVRDLERETNDLSVKVAVAQGQASAMAELAAQQQQKSSLSVKEAEQRYANEILTLRSTLDFKTNELEHILTHNATLKRLADTAEHGQTRATEFASTANAPVLAGYLIKQHVAPSHGAGRPKWYQRYFVLNGTQLSFYETQDDYERQRSDNPPMDVSGATIEDNFAIPEAFSITFPQEKYYPLHLHAKSGEVKREWVDTLRHAAGGHANSGGSYGNTPHAGGVGNARSMSSSSDGSYVSASGGSSQAHNYNSSVQGYGVNASNAIYGTQQSSASNSSSNYGGSSYSAGGNAAYGNSAAAYGNSAPGYGNAAYGNGAAAYGNSNSAYGNNAPGYGNSNPAYGAPPAYGNSSANYGNNAYGHNNNSNAYGNNGAYGNANNGSYGYGR